MNGYDHMAITQNYLSNVYSWAHMNKAIYDNDTLIDQLLLSLSNYDEKIEISEALLISLYQISNKQIKDKIKKFIVAIKTNPTPSHTYINFELLLLANKIKRYNKKLLPLIDTYLKDYENGGFSSSLPTTRDYLKYLSRTRNEFKPYLNRINTVIDNYKTRDRLSVI